MSRFLLLSFLLLAFALSTLAQQSSSPHNSTSKQTAEQTMTGSRAVSSSKQTQHITGCLAKQNGEYVLKEKNGRVANVTSTLDLASQVGHELTATGTWQPNTSATAGIPPKGGAKGEVIDNPNQLLVVGHMKIRSNTCK